MLRESGPAGLGFELATCQSQVQRPTAAPTRNTVCLCVCLLVTFVSPAKTAEPIDMPFGGRLGWVQGTMY